MVAEGGRAVKTKQTRLPAAAASAVSGAGAGALTTTLCSPLDVVKTRMQVRDAILRGEARTGSERPGVAHFLRTIYHEEGVRGWFRGYSSAMVVVPIFWAIYFPCYRQACTVLGDLSDNKPLVHMGAAVCGGLITDVATNPLWVARTRLVSQHLHVKYRGAPVQYTGTVQCMRLIVRQEGWRGLYKGLTASFLGLSHVAVQFPLYEYLKDRTLPPKETVAGGENDAAITAGPQAFAVLLASTGSKLVASTVTYPHEVVRARLQDHRGAAAMAVVQQQGATAGSDLSAPSTGVASRGGGGCGSIARAEPPSLGLMQTFMSILRRDGVPGLYRGLVVNLVRVIPSTAVTFVTYEYLRSIL